MEEKIRRLAKWAKGKEAPPLTLELNITNRCNLRCRFCWLRSFKPNYKEEMEDKRLLEIVEEAIEIGVEEFRFPGSGEPLTRKNILFELIEKVKEHGKSVLLISNGTLFTEDDVKKIIQMNLDVLTISLDGPNKEINDYLRGKNAFSRTIKTLRSIKELKRKLRKSNPWLRMNVVLTNKNYDKLNEMILLARKFGFKEVLLQPMTVFSEEGKKLKLREKEMEELNKYLERASEEARKLGIRTNMKNFIRSEIVGKTSEMNELMKKIKDEFKNSFLSSPCFEPWYNLIILPNGSVGPCAISGGIRELNAKEMSLNEIWYGKYFNQFREKLLRGELFDFCSHCCVPVYLENNRIRRELAKVIG